ncbi:MAG: 2,3-bisphosphoglycerate-independent phosphoglycerate mutase [Legionellales bacterium]|nr:2,3-bisphosphoglycerate-independent phosphoglycerate mutase [Legionellales bacterium]
MIKCPKPMLLIVLDGWGYRTDPLYNAIASAHKPNWDRLNDTYPHTVIKGSGTCVGLPVGQMGNSEVGHVNLGLGRIVRQDYTRIGEALDSGAFFRNDILIQSVLQAITNNKTLHVLGLLSPGGVHSHEDHFFAFIKLAGQLGLKKLAVHAFLDGRDTPPQSAAASLEKLEEVLKEAGTGKIASVCGRYYAMDRDKRWDRVKKAYDMLISGAGAYRADSALLALAESYERGETDEFVAPTLIQPENESCCLIEAGDVVVFMNFRADRARELSNALTQNHFEGFDRGQWPKLELFVTLTQYAKDMPAQVAFSPQSLSKGLGEIISAHGLKQLRIAETEKYAHVTFFFNGGTETVYPGEDRILIPSPHVATYDLQPEMSAYPLTEQLVSAIKSEHYDLIVCNFANPDMVGHTGNFDAAIKAIETIDVCLGRIYQALIEVGGEMLITADHGNAECMFDEKTAQPHTAHTNAPVPLIYVGTRAKFIVEDGKLADVAPTLLYLMGLEIPSEMEGNILLK